MVPSATSLFQTSTSTTTVVQPTNNYKMWRDEKMINGYHDQLEAMKQVIFKILNTERYQYNIYSWNYGVELKELFGKPLSYVCPEIERCIKEALLQDNRIESVENFIFELVDKKTVHVEFTVKTIFGELETDWEVNLNV